MMAIIVGLAIGGTNGKVGKQIALACLDACGVLRTGTVLGCG